MNRNTKKQKTLQKELHDLQTNGTVTWANFRKSNFEFYKHIAEIYFWWRKAVAIESYLEAEYAKLGRQYKTNVIYGTNYSPLLWLVWGENQCSTSDSDRHSRALNTIDAEYLKRLSYYKKDKVERMAKFIESNNGIGGLCGYGLAKKDEEDIEQLITNKQLQANTRQSNELSHQERTVVGYDAAINHYATNSVAPLIDFGTVLATNADDLSLILAKRTASGYQLLGSTNDEDLIKATAIKNFKHDFNALPIEVKCVVEAIRSQAIPLTLLKERKHLIERTKGKNQQLMYRRLVYCANTSAFLYSSVRTNSSVVTKVTPHQSIFADVVSDIFLSPLTSNVVESKLIATNEFNTYQRFDTQANTQLLEEFGVYKLIRLQNIFNYSDFVILDFWRFDTNTNLPLTQVCVAETAFDKTNWEHTLDIGLFRHMALEVLDKWITSHAKYIKRKEGNLCQLVLSQNSLTLQFVEKFDDFEEKYEFLFVKPTKQIATTTLKFYCKDMMFVLRSIADYDTPLIQVRANKSALQFEFVNATATIQITVPTLDKKGLRSADAFDKFEARALPLLSAEYTSDSDSEKDLVLDMEVV